MPIKLWSYCGMHHAEDGKLTSYGPEEIETVAGWWGEKGRAVEALLTVGFLENIEGNFQVRHWLDHAGHLAAFRKRAKSAAKKRWSRYASSIPTSITKDKRKQSPSRGKARESTVLNLSFPDPDPEREQPSKVPKPDMSVQEFVESWNDFFSDTLPAVEWPIAKSRHEKAALRLKEHLSMEFWERVFRNIGASDYLTGKVVKWRCTFDFLIANDNNVMKIFEGNYENGKSEQRQGYRTQSRR